MWAIAALKGGRAALEGHYVLQPADPECTVGVEKPAVPAVLRHPAFGIPLLHLAVLDTAERLAAPKPDTTRRCNVQAVEMRKLRNGAQLVSGEIRSRVPAVGAGRLLQFLQ